MIRKTRVRTAAAAAALATSVAIAVTATGAARADNSTPQPAADGAPAAASDAGPPRAVAFAARDPLRGATHYVVTAGDSYWAIAESVLGVDAAPGDVLAKTEELIQLNGARLGYDNPQMLHPGDVVYLEALAPTPVTVLVS